MDLIRAIGFGKVHGVSDMTVEDMGVKQIEQAIVKLPSRELAELVTWLEDYHDRVWDKRIEEDLESGRLDALLTRVDEEYKAGLTESL
jgi:hypothetical protein